MRIARAAAIIGVLLALLYTGPALGAAPAGTIETIAGGGIGEGRAGLETHLSGTHAIATDADGNVYWTENGALGAQRVRVWDRATDRVRTVAGTGLAQNPITQRFGDGGPALRAVLHNPFGLAIDSKDNVYVYDFTGTGRIRRVDPVTGVIGQVATAGSIFAAAIEIDSQDRVYFSNYNQLMRYDPKTGATERIAGSYDMLAQDLDEQPATSVRIGEPEDIAVDAAGNVYFSQAGGLPNGRRIRWIDTAGIIHTLVGGPLATSTADGEYGFRTTLDASQHLLLTRPDGSLWFTDGARVRSVAPAPEIAQVPGSRRVTTAFDVTGGDVDGPLAQAGIGSIWDWEETTGGGFVIADAGNRKVRVVQGGTVTTVAGNGMSKTFNDPGPDIYDWTGDGLAATNATLADPCAVAADADGNVYVGESGYHHRVRRIDAATGVISTAAGIADAGYEGDGGPATEAKLDRPCGLAFGPGGDLYVSDGAQHVVRRVDAGTGVITTVAGTGANTSTGDGGPAATATLMNPSRMAFDPAGNLYVSDASAHRVRKIWTDGTISTAAGSGVAGYSGDGGPAGVAKLNAPRGLGVLPDGSLVIADSNNAAVRRVSPSGTITTIISPDEIDYPNGLAVDPVTGAIFVVDSPSGHRVVKLRPGATAVELVAGNGDADFCGDGGPASEACLRNPQGLALTPEGDLLISDLTNLRVRRVVGVA